MSDTTEKVIDTAADVAGEVKDQAENIEQAIRALNRMRVKYYAIGMAVGGITGAVIAFKVAYARAETKYSKIADEEISEMRQHYREKTRAAESEAAKRPLEDIVKDHGYSSPDNKTNTPPMAVQPPVAVVLENQSEDEEQEKPFEDEEESLQEPDEPEVRNIFRERQEAQDSWIEPDWNYHEELRRRSPDSPYVIHYDERHEMEYQDVTLTYYEVDDVLCNERDEIIDPDGRDDMIGKDTLQRFGHGSKDADIVFVRNDKLEIMFEICRSPNSFAEEVHGLRHDEVFFSNVERMRIKERDEQDD